MTDMSEKRFAAMIGERKLFYFHVRKIADGFKRADGLLRNKQAEMSTAIVEKFNFPYRGLNLSGRLLFKLKSDFDGNEPKRHWER